jgi:hypothetical protein
VSELFGFKQEARMQVMSNGKVRRSEGEWREILSRYERGGLRAREFCRREEIHLASFLRWQRKLDGSGKASAFVPVRTAPSVSSSSSSWSLEISLPNGCRLRFRG